MDEMMRIKRCRYCGRLDYYGEMRWLSGRCVCRDCYREDYERQTGKPYTWDDLDGPRPTEEELRAQKERSTENLKQYIEGGKRS